MIKNTKNTWNALQISLLLLKNGETDLVATREENGTDVYFLKMLVVSQIHG